MRLKYGERLLSEMFSEFLVHAADVEGLCRGIDEDLVISSVLCTMLTAYTDTAPF